MLRAGQILRHGYAQGDQTVAIYRFHANGIHPQYVCIGVLVDGIERGA